MVVVDNLDEGLDLVALLLTGLRHAAGDLGRVALNAGNQGVAERVRLVAVVDGLDDDDLEEEKSMSAFGPFNIVYAIMISFPPSSSPSFHAINITLPRVKVAFVFFFLPFCYIPSMRRQPRNDGGNF